MLDAASILSRANLDKWDRDHDETENVAGNVSELFYSKQGNTYRPVGDVVNSLSAGFYNIDRDNHGLIIEAITRTSDELINLPGSVAERVVEDINKFWNMSEQYKELNLVHKRGVLMHGRPGIGKTATINIVAQQVVDAGGIVVYFNNPIDVVDGLNVIRLTNPTTPILCVMEEIEELLDKHGESNILLLLDGERQIDNVVYFATTNYIDELPPRIAKRPSRFDLVIELDLLDVAVRKEYLECKLKRTVELTDPMLTETAEYGIAHLKELIILTEIFGEDVMTAIGRINEIVAIDVDDEDD